MKLPLNSIEPTEASRSALLYFVVQWRLASAAHAERKLMKNKAVLLLSSGFLLLPPLTKQSGRKRPPRP
jgi:hypothetical protein